MGGGFGLRVEGLRVLVLLESFRLQGFVKWSEVSLTRLDIHNPPCILSTVKAS